MEAQKPLEQETPETTPQEVPTATIPQPESTPAANMEADPIPKEMDASPESPAKKTAGKLAALIGGGIVAVLGIFYLVLCIVSASHGTILGRTDVMERISVNRSYAVSRVATGEEERIAVYLEAAFNNYIIETESGKVLQGDPETRYEKRYLLTFVRTLGAKTDASGATETIQCPHCGANVEVIRSGKCEYCGSVVYSEVYDWVLDELDAAGR